MARPLRIPSQPDEDRCPVPDEFLGRLYRAPQKNLSDILATLPQRQRANLAVFCYGRAHLHEIGMAIASTCDLPSLLVAAGKAGEAIYAQCREQMEPKAQVATKRGITLATSASALPGLTIPPLETFDVDDPEASEPEVEPAGELIEATAPELVPVA